MIERINRILTEIMSKETKPGMGNPGVGGKGERGDVIHELKSIGENRILKIIKMIIYHLILYRNFEIIMLIYITVKG